MTSCVITVLGTTHPTASVALDLTAARPLYTYTFHLHLQNTHATDVRILVCSFPPVAEGLAPPPPEL